MLNKGLIRLGAEVDARLERDMYTWDYARLAAVSAPDGPCRKAAHAHDRGAYCPQTHTSAQSTTRNSTGVAPTPTSGWLARVAHAADRSSGGPSGVFPEATPELPPCDSVRAAGDS